MYYDYVTSTSDFLPFTLSISPTGQPVVLCIRALGLRFYSKVNAINPDYAWKLGFKIWKTNIGAQKIDSSALKTFGIVIADFQMENKTNKPRFF